MEGRPHKQNWDWRYEDLKLHVKDCANISKSTDLIKKIGLV